MIATVMKMTNRRLIPALLLAMTLLMACASNPSDSRAKQGAKTGAAVGAGIGLLLGVLSGDSRVAAAGLAVGAGVGAAQGGYEGWRQDQHDERTREITQAIRETDRNSQQAGQDAEARQREHLTRFLGIWQMSGWVQEPGQDRINVSAQVNGTVQMNYFVEMAYIDLKADGFDDQIWGTSTFGYDANNGFELSTRFNTLPDSIDAAGGTFDSNRRTFTFADSAGTTTIRFETPDRFNIITVAGGSTVESYTFTRS